MSRFRQQHASEELQVGDSFIASRRFNLEDIQLFTRISRVYQPAFFDACCAEAAVFKALVSHELLTASLVTEVGRKIGWVGDSITFHFTQQVYTGDMITCHWVIKTLGNQGRATAKITMTNEAGMTVMDAEACGVVSSFAGHNNKKGLSAPI
jgi:3-hydroxybutyryl-CoA dehydratase